MGLLDRLFGKPSVAEFAAQMMQAFREAGDKTDLRFGATENRIVCDDRGSEWAVLCVASSEILEDGNAVGSARPTIEIWTKTPIGEGGTCRAPRRRA